MFLKEIHSFTPNKHAFTINSKLHSIAVHPSSDYLAFVTRNQQLAMYNRKTGRLAVALKSKHQIVFFLYTQKYLVVIEKNFPEIIIYSLKSEKLKKKLTGHRTQVQKIAYCPQRGLICSISHDVCLIWDQATLNIQKTLKCSTTQYRDCLFSPNGKYLFTSFCDGNVFRWNLDTFQQSQTALSIRPHNLSCTYSHFIVAYEPKSIKVADYTQQNLVFQQIQAFWQGLVQKTDFSNNNLFIKTSKGFYISQIYKQYQILVKQAKKLVEKIHQFTIGGYGEEIVTISKDLLTIKTMKLFSQASTKQIPLTNPLINPGKQCAGGFSNKQGCIADQGQIKSYAYEQQNLKVQQLNNGIYEYKDTLAPQKLQFFIRKNFFFPDKYRPIAYKSLLYLPINKNMFRDIEKKGRHQCVKMLQSKYPLTNRNLAEAFKDIISLLANYCPVFAQSQEVPTIVFPFVCLFGNDIYLCFEILYRLFNNWLSFIFTDFPLANSQLLQNMHEILQRETPQIINHFEANNISLTKLVWNFLSTLFASNVKRQVFLAIIDTLFSHPSQPQYIVYIVIAYISYNESRILSMRSQQDLDSFLDRQHTVNTSVFLKKFYEIENKYHNMLRYPFQKMNPHLKQYIIFEDYPKHAVKMYEGKRRLQQEQYDKAMDNKKYHQQMAKQMNNMMVQAKRGTQKAMIESQSVALQSQNESKNKLNMPNINQKLRRQRLQQLIQQLKELISKSEQKKTKMKQFSPLLNQVYEQQNDQQLQILESKLMKMLTQFEPNRFHRPIKSVPLSLGKNKVEDYNKLKAAKNAQMTKTLWENDKIHHKVQEQSWQNNFMNSMK